MADLNDVLELKKRVEKLQRDADRAAGALAQTLAQLKSEFGCSSLEAAEALLKKAKTDEQKAQVAFDTALAAFEEEWGEALN
jgi:hypothetical protein